MTNHPRPKRGPLFRRPRFTIAQMMAGICVFALALSVSNLLKSYVYWPHGHPTTPPMNLGWLCSNESQWFDELAERCREQAVNGVPWDSAREEDNLLKTRFWVGDGPVSRTWYDQAAYLERCSRRAASAARRLGGW
jgi:hypothetical protein